MPPATTAPSTAGVSAAETAGNEARLPLGSSSAGTGGGTIDGLIGGGPRAAVAAAVATAGCEDGVKMTEEMAPAMLVAAASTPPVMVPDKSDPATVTTAGDRLGGASSGDGGGGMAAAAAAAAALTLFTATLRATRDGDAKTSSPLYCESADWRADRMPRRRAMSFVDSREVSAAAGV